MSRYKMWSEIEKRCVAMTRDVYKTPNRTWVTYVCYRRTKGVYLEAFAILMMVPPDRDPTTDLWRTFRKSTRTLRTFELPSWIKSHDVFVVAPRFRPDEPLQPWDDVDSLGVHAV